jgi:hypothetical protein
VLRALLTIWLVAFPVASCGSIVIGSIAGSAGTTTVLGGVVFGSLFLVPWLIGILVLGLLAVLTK